MSNWQIKLLYDGACPVCSREMQTLRRRDTDRQILFEDIAATDFDAGRYGLSRAEVNAVMHGILPDGTVVRGMEVIRRAYAAIGRGWLLAPTAWPVLRQVSDVAYRVWARFRPTLSRRCADDTCAVAPPKPPEGSA
ncbi:MAG: DUF393 domain-containing protein [Phycisphaerae bacterium]|nr:DUF393 domain-containing protein [Phycisphaerae bacterium]